MSSEAWQEVARLVALVPSIAFRQARDPRTHSLEAAAIPASLNKSRGLGR